MTSGELMGDLILRIVLGALVVLVALGIGLWLRHLAVRRLKRTVLDAWLVQTIGVLIVIPALILGVAGLLLILSMGIDLINYVWSAITAGLQGKDIADAVRNLAGRVIFTLLIVVLGIGTARTIMRLTIGRLGEQRLDINLRTLIGRIIYSIVIIILVFWLLSLWQVSFDVPVTVIGAISVAVTFAVQDILKDLVAGLYILLERPFHIGDQITTATYTGVVENVELRATRIRLATGEEMTIPNAMIFGGIVVNNTRFDERRASITLTMPQDEFNKEETPAQILKIAREVENVLMKPEPAVFVSRYSGTFGGTTGSTTGYNVQIVILTLRFWIATGHYTTVTEVMSALHRVLPNVDLLVEDAGGNV
jgi:small-conductance mechanosensitive channel